MLIPYANALDLMLDTRPLLLDQPAFPAVRRLPLEILQVNLGYRCNLSCNHCHVNAGPRRREAMNAEIADLVIDFARRRQLRILDLTGGAPEMNAHFRRMVTQARELGMEVIDRCNLTILLEPGYEDLAEFLAGHGVTVTASLPCYLEKNVELQRGKGIYSSSIEALRRLNALGYGSDPALRLNLVYNPVGPQLPPPQAGLQADYKQALHEHYGIVFNELYTITNMPISRFGGTLLARGQFEQYMQLLRDNYADANLETVMCRNMISVDYRGYVYDCDFNQMLDMPMIATSRQRPHLRDLMSATLEGRPVAVAGHCFGCTAGQGSSCGGALG